MFAKLKALAATVWADICDTYKRLKVILIVIGGAVIYFEWNNIKEKLLLAQGKQALKTDEKKDQVLATQETTDSQKADALVKQSQNLASTEKPVDDNWNKE